MHRNAGLLVLLLAVGGTGFGLERNSRMDVNKLVADLQAAEESTRVAAAEKLAQAEGELQLVALEVVETLPDQPEQVREWLVEALENMGPPDSGDVAPLAELLKHANRDVAYWAATLLGRLKKGAATAQGALADCVGAHPEMAARQRAVWALGKIGLPSEAARAALTKAATSDNPRLARMAREALEAISH